MEEVLTIIKGLEESRLFGAIAVIIVALLVWQGGRGILAALEILVRLLDQHQKNGIEHEQLRLANDRLRAELDERRRKMERKRPQVDDSQP